MVLQLLASMPGVLIGGGHTGIAEDLEGVLPI